jgi:hypothetical protein
MAAIAVSSKRSSLRAIVQVVCDSAASDIYLSYSSEGMIQLDALSAALSGFGQVEVHSLGEVRRYLSSRAAARNGRRVVEYLIHLRKRTVVCE